MKKFVQWITALICWTLSKKLCKWKQDSALLSRSAFVDGMTWKGDIVVSNLLIEKNGLLTYAFM